MNRQARQGNTEKSREPIYTFIIEQVFEKGKRFGFEYANLFGGKKCIDGRDVSRPYRRGDICGLCRWRLKPSS